MSDQGTMTHRALGALLAERVAAVHPEVPTRDRDKVEILQGVLEVAGWAAVVALGTELRRLRAHPVLQAILRGATPARVLERWMQLERYGHSRNTTEFVERPSDGNCIRVRHVASDGGHIVSVNDLFVWGLLIGLLEEARTVGLRAHFDGERAAFYPELDPAHALPSRTHAIALHWESVEPLVESERTPTTNEESTLTTRLTRLFQRDLLQRWTTAAAARALGLSSRSLQRALKDEGATFSSTLQRARVLEAHALLQDPHASLADIAFCTGFSDHAHLTRLFRKHLDVPPAALRALKRSG